MVEGSETFSRSAFLGRVDDRARRDLLSMGTLVRVAANEDLLREGDPGEFALLVLSGVAKVTTVDVAGAAVILDLATAGDVLGEAAVVDRTVGRMATVTAKTPMTVRRIGADEFERFLRTCPGAGFELLVTVVRRNRVAQRQRRASRLPATPARLAQRLDDLVDLVGHRTNEGWELRVPMTREEIAAFVPLGRTRLIEMLDVLVHEGLVHRSRKTVTVVDREGLRLLAESEHRPAE